MKRMHVYVGGLVQGVFFRAATRQAAVELNITGWVRNMGDGRVEAVFEGKDADVEKMIAWCKIGPPAAIVEKVTTMEENYTGDFNNFSIRYL